jgi:hypothetical protein
MSEEKVLEILNDLGNEFEAMGVKLKHATAELVTKGATEKPKNAVTVPEQTFDLLKFEPQKGEKLGEFEIADKKNSIAQNWTQAFNILNQNNATINNRFHGLGYVYAYWTYQERIYRKKLKGSPESTPTGIDVSLKSAADLFPQDLAVILQFKEEEGCTVIKPRQFLGSDNFSKIAAIVRSANGEYVSAGKASHFRIPKKA